MKPRATTILGQIKELKRNIEGIKSNQNIGSDNIQIDIRYLSTLGDYDQTLTSVGSAGEYKIVTFTPDENTVGLGIPYNIVVNWTQTSGYYSDIIVQRLKVVDNVSSWIIGFTGNDSDPTPSIQLKSLIQTNATGMIEYI